MSKKSKAPASMVSAEDALRLRVALLELEQIKVSAAKAVEDAAKAADALKTEMWARYGLAPDDSVDLKTFAIARVG